MPPRLVAGQELAGRYRLLEPADAPLGERWRVADDRGPDGFLTLLAPPRPGLAPEARDAALAALRGFGHPHAVAARDAGALGDAAYVVSNVPDGRPLRAWAASLGGPVALRDVRAVVDQVAQALGAAHRGVGGVGLVHGASLAPSTFVARRGELHVAALADVGLLALSSPPSTPPPGAGDVPSASDDVYGLGALLVELLVGAAHDPHADLDAAMARLAAARPEVDPSVWQLARRCLAHDPAARPAGVARVRDLVRQAVWTPREVRAAPEPAREPPPAAPPPAPPPPQPERARVVAVVTAPAAPPPRVEAPAAPPPPRRVSLLELAEPTDVVVVPPDLRESTDVVALPPAAVDATGEDTALVMTLPGAALDAEAPGVTLVPRRAPAAVVAPPRDPEGTAALDVAGLHDVEPIDGDAFATLRPSRLHAADLERAIGPLGLAAPPDEAHATLPARRPATLAPSGHPLRASLPSPPPRASLPPVSSPPPAPVAPAPPADASPGLALWWALAALAAVALVAVVALAAAR